MKKVEKCRLVGLMMIAQVTAKLECDSLSDERNDTWRYQNQCSDRYTTLTGGMKFRPNQIHSCLIYYSRQSLKQALARNQRQF
jgi:hypothetical protein